jgi:hypothetical protein
VTYREPDRELQRQLAEDEARGRQLFELAAAGRKRRDARAQRENTEHQTALAEARNPEALPNEYEEQVDARITKRARIPSTALYLLLPLLWLPIVAIAAVTVGGWGYLVAPIVVLAFVLLVLAIRKGWPKAAGVRIPRALPVHPSFVVTNHVPSRAPREIRAVMARVVFEDPSVLPSAELVADVLGRIAADVVVFSNAAVWPQEATRELKAEATRTGVSEHERAICIVRLIADRQGDQTAARWTRRWLDEVLVPLHACFPIAHVEFSVG